jgi:prevent-host-death family protein
MRELSVTEFKSQLSRVLREVQKGESFLIVYGKERRPVAQIVPVKESMKKKRGLSGNVK